MKHTHARPQRLALGLAIAILTTATFFGVARYSLAAQPDIPTAVKAVCAEMGVTITSSEAIEPDGEWTWGGTIFAWQIGGSRQGMTVGFMVEEHRTHDEAMAHYESWKEFGGFQDTVNDESGWSHVSETIVSLGDSIEDDPTMATTAWTTFVNGPYLIHVTQRPSNDTPSTRQVALALDAELDGTGSGTGSGEPEVIEEPPQEDGLSASALPSTFSKPSDTARVSVRLSGENAVGQQVSLSGHGQDQTAVTDPSGGAVFSVTHDDETITEYRFVVSAMGMQQTVTIPVLALQIILEINPATGEPFLGVAADGKSSLGIEIDLGESGSGALRVASPQFGTLDGDALESDGGIALSDGKALLAYTPPPYVDGSLLAERIVPLEQTGYTLGSARTAKTVYANQGSPWATKVPLEFEYTSADGIATPVIVDVLVTRAPVMLVHGFTGDKTTWAGLADQLARDGFDPVINEYYEGDQGIHDQSRALEGDIAREIERYSSLGVRVSRVDIVGHSMGGLISRNYTWGVEPHPTDVRKIIMVGTPNHGAGWFDAWLGEEISERVDAHKLAAKQLYSGSDFMAEINEGETVGRHLNPDVQYGNIYGERSDYVVANTSAHLNGVMSRRLYGVTHSPAVELPGQPITTSATVFSWVVDWLGSDIPRAALRGTEVRIESGIGDVQLAGVDFSTGHEVVEDVSSYPTIVDPWEEVHTGSDGRARLRLMLDGLAWGTIHVAPDTKLALGNIAPGAVTVRVRSGSARFTSLRREGGGHFQVVVGEQPPGEWYTFQPDAKIIGLDTDFVVSADGDGAVETLVLEGEALIDDGSTTDTDEMPVLGENQAGAVGVPSGYTSELAQNQWWSDGFYRPSLQEVFADWWAILRSFVESVIHPNAVEVSEPPVAIEVE